MALTPEDNTGLATADSYVDLATFKLYCAARGIDPTALVLAGDSGTDTVLENLCRIGFQYVNTEFEPYKSFPINNNQAGEFPRINLSDGAGRVFNVVPQRVKDAQCEAAIAQGQGNDLFAVATRGGAIASETVGPISTSYRADAPPETYFQAVKRLLQPFMRDPNNPRRPLPVYNDFGGSDPVFSVGMDNNPDLGPNSVIQ